MIHKILTLSPIHIETMLRMHHVHNEMLNHSNHIAVGSFKVIFQGVDTNNLQAVLQALKELNFILANKAPKLSAYYGFPSEPHATNPAEEVPDFVSEYLSRPATHPADHSNRGRLQEQEATTSTDLQDSHHQSLEVTMKMELDIHTGQMHIFTIITTQIDSNIKRDHQGINPGIVTETGITHTTPQKPQN